MNASVRMLVPGRRLCEGRPPRPLRSAPMVAPAPNRPPPPPAEAPFSLAPAPPPPCLPPPLSPALEPLLPKEGAGVRVPVLRPVSKNFHVSFVFSTVKAAAAAAALAATAAAASASAKAAEVAAAKDESLKAVAADGKDPSSPGEGRGNVGARDSAGGDGEACRTDDIGKDALAAGAAGRPPLRVLKKSVMLRLTPPTGTVDGDAEAAAGDAKVEAPAAADADAGTVEPIFTSSSSSSMTHTSGVR